MWLCELLTLPLTIVRRSASTASSTCLTRAFGPIGRLTISRRRARTSTGSPGFAANQIELVQHGATLLVTGQKGEQPELLHQGIPLSFKQSFNLADHVKVIGASVEHGLLTIDLVREVPEQLKPRRIEIGGAGAKAAKQDNQTKQIDATAKKVA